MWKMKTKAAGMIAGLVAAAMIFGNGIVMNGSGANTASAAESAPVEINETNFPDPKFRAVIAGPDYDRDGNGVLDADEISRTINIHCDGEGIKSIKGVEFFSALEGLWCMDNAIETMDLTQNKALHGVWCSGNKFTALDFSANPELEWVYCFDCNLTSLNVSNNPKMAFIECNTNPLPKLDVSKNPLLEHLTCGNCELTSLDLTNNPKLAHLDAFGNHLTKLDVSNNPKLKRLDIWNNPGLGSIDVSHNTGLQYYNCAYNKATSVDVSKNRELQKLICSYNQITKLDLSNNPKLFYLDCACNQLSSLDLSKNDQLHFLQAFTNEFTTLDIGNNPLLVKTYKEGKKKAEYEVCKGHSWTIDYGGDTSTGGDNLYFLCFDDAVTLKTEAKSATPTPTPTKAADKTEEKNLVTREAAVQKLYEMAGKPSVAGLTSRFKDVKKGASYEAALLWGEAYAIAVGTPDVSSDRFGVGEYVTIQDLLLMLMRYSEYMGYNRAIDFGRSDDFADYYEIDQYAWEAVCWAITWHITDGKGDPNAPKEQRKIDPHGKATRSEFEEMLKRLLEVNKGVKTTTPTPKAPTPTNTPKPTSTPTPTSTPKPTETPTPTNTPKPTETPKVTDTPEPTGTPTPSEAALTTVPTEAVPAPTEAVPTLTEAAPAPTEAVPTRAESIPTPAEATPTQTPDGVTITPQAGDVTPTEAPQEERNAAEAKDDKSGPNYLLYALILVSVIAVGEGCWLIAGRKRKHDAE